MMRWPDRPICAFDLETTDRDPRTARIVSACVATFDGDRIESRTWLLDPGIPIPDETVAIHGITPERARAEGQDYASGYAQIREALCESWVRDHIVVAFNASYDLTVIDAEGRTHRATTVCVCCASMVPRRDRRGRPTPATRTRAR